MKNQLEQINSMLFYPHILSTSSKFAQCSVQESYTKLPYPLEMRDDTTCPLKANHNSTNLGVLAHSDGQKAILLSPLSHSPRIEALMACAEVQVIYVPGR